MRKRPRSGICRRMEPHQAKIPRLEGDMTTSASHFDNTRGVVDARYWDSSIGVLYFYLAHTISDTFSLALSFFWGVFFFTHSTSRAESHGSWGTTCHVISTSPYFHHHAMRTVSTPSARPAAEAKRLPQLTETEPQHYNHQSQKVKQSVWPWPPPPGQPLCKRAG